MIECLCLGCCHNNTTTGYKYLLAGVSLGCGCCDMTGYVSCAAVVEVLTYHDTQRRHCSPPFQNGSNDSPHPHLPVGHSNLGYALGSWPSPPWQSCLPVRPLQGLTPSCISGDVFPLSSYMRSYKCVPHACRWMWGRYVCVT